MLPRGEVGDRGELVRLGASAAPDGAGLAGAEESLLVRPPLLEARLSGGVGVVVSRPSGIL